MEEQFTTHIKSQNGWFDLNIQELIQYKDLIFLFVKRTYTALYKQTILGPLWLVLNPLITTLLFTLIFGKVAGLSTDGSPSIAFYLSGNALWSYFSTCIINTSKTFTDNAAILGKVYFPRLTIPIATVITALLDLSIQIIMLLAILVLYALSGTTINTNIWLLSMPLLVFQIALLGLGCGIIISSLTTKYRDLTILVGFGVQLWMYVSPVVYSITEIPSTYRPLYMINPIAPILTIWRQAWFGTGIIPVNYWILSWFITLLLLFIGILLFSHIEKTFTDTV